MPRSDRVPSMITRIVEVLSPTNPLGIKAGGEGGTTAAPAAIVSAVVDALAPYGIDDIKMPVTPDRIGMRSGMRKPARPAKAARSCGSTPAARPRPT